MTRRKRNESGPASASASASDDADAELLGALGLLRERRTPYAELLAGIVAETLDRFPLGPASAGDGLVVEIGAGVGQLRQWLPATARTLWGDRLVHTDPSEAALRLLRERAPQAKTRVAAAETLPFADGGCGGVLGLCVFDAISDATAVVAELGRVLGPGGRFVHFMDMATLLEQPFAKLAASRLVPLPNVFGDPGDHEWPLDIVLVGRDWLAGLLDWAARSGHALSTRFTEYFAAFLTEPFDAGQGTRLFKAIASNGEQRQLLATLLVSASRTAFGQGYPAIDPLPFHSGRHLQSVLETSFRASDVFRIEQNEIVTRSTWRPRFAGGAGRYQSLCLGHQRVAAELPGRLLTESAKLRLGPDGPPPGEALVEAGVFVFVARRV